METMKTQKIPPQNHPFSGRVLGLKNTSFWNPQDENDPFKMVVSGNFFLQLRNAKYHVFRRKKYMEM